jgi:glutaminyl-peptide cyclotransferase
VARDVRRQHLAVRHAARPLALSLGLAVVTLLGLALAACDRAPRVERLAPVVIDTWPHDPEAFTQGLVWDEGRFLESTGRYGRSQLREVDATSGEVLRARSLSPREFGEGLALVGDRLIQLTYREGVAHVYDRTSFEPVGRFRYQGEGWGLCFDGEALWMSDGSDRLARRDPATFDVLGSLDVTLDGVGVSRLNELACVGTHVYANVWTSDEVMRIRTTDGRVDAVIDASALVPDEPRVRLDPDAVLNGIAYDPVEERFFLTGKLWDVMYVVRFEPAAR